MVRSLGLCVEYTRTDKLPSDNNGIVRPRRSVGDLLLNSYLPVGGVSDLLFGVVPRNQNLHCFDREMGTLDEINAFLDFLDNSGAHNLGLAEDLKLSRKARPGWIPGFNDLIPLTAAKMSSVASSLRNLPMPNNYSPGLLRTREGLQVFCHRLHSFIAQRAESVSPQLLKVQEWVSTFENQFDKFWNANDSTWAYVAPNQMVLPVPAYKAAEAYQVEIHKALDKAEGFLKAINDDPYGSVRNDLKDRKLGFCYDTLLVEHLRMAIKAYGKIKEKKDYPVHWWLPVGREWLSASMHVYWDDLEDLSEKVAEYTGCSVELAVDAWVTMVFRAFCWHHCHHLMATVMVLPSEWRGSQMPIYIG